MFAQSRTIHLLHHIEFEYILCEIYARAAVGNGGGDGGVSFFYFFACSRRIRFCFSFSARSIFLIHFFAFVLFLIFPRCFLSSSWMLLYWRLHHSLLTGKCMLSFFRRSQIALSPRPRFCSLAVNLYIIFFPVTYS